MLTMLEKKGLIIPSHEEPPAYLPAKDLETISIREILDVVRISEDEALAGNKFIAIPKVDGMISQMDDALYQSVKNETLKDLIISGRKQIRMIDRSVDISAARIIFQESI